MTSLARAFVALVPPADALEHVDATVARLRDEWPGLRWMPRAQRHVTLQFLGGIDDTDSVIAELQGINVEPFRVRLGGGSAFPKPRAATVLWVGVVDGGAPMTELAAAVGAATARLGIADEDRPFRPHLTLARARRATDLRPAVAVLDDAAPGPRWDASEIVLFDSDTRASGAVHTEIARIPLAPRSRP